MAAGAWFMIPVVQNPFFPEASVLIFFFIFKKNFVLLIIRITIISEDSESIDKPKKDAHNPVFRDNQC